MNALMTIPRSGGGDFQDPQAGVYPAVCVQVIDLGTQTNTYEGKTTHKHQLMLRFELHGESLTTDANGYMLDENGALDTSRPFLVGTFLTVSFHEEANLRKHMEAWRGVPYTDEQLDEFETQGFDWNKMLGVPCMVTMSPNTKGKVKLSGITKLQKNIEAPKPVGETFAFVLSAFDRDIWEKLPEGIKGMITKSPEYQAQFGDYKPSTTEQSSPVEPFDDSIPF
jgi:hypothetical protein